MLQQQTIVLEEEKVALQQLISSTNETPVDNPIKVSSSNMKRLLCNIIDANIFMTLKNKYVFIYQIFFLILAINLSYTENDYSIHS